MRVALLVNIPAPYRVPVYDRLAERLGEDFKVIYMAELESNRKWKVPELKHAHQYLKGFTLSRGTRHVHVRFGVFTALLKFKPDVVITAGFNPPMLMGWLYTRLFGKAHVPMSDAWVGSEANLSGLHRYIRRLVFGSSKAFIGASQQTLELFKSYGVEKNLFKACLCVDNSRFTPLAGPVAHRAYDLVFSGSLIEGKLPLFFVEVVKRLAGKMPKLSVLVIGDGALRDSMHEALATLPTVHTTFTGYLQQSELPAYYVQGKIFCFPTKRDAWGIVANEACASGMAVLTCANAGCAVELIVNNHNGYVLPLEPEVWAEHAAKLLGDEMLLSEMSQNAIRSVEEYTYDHAARGILAACEA
ncbi:MAG: glycosyltransferase family 4 protein [Gammaproteobacteria bacterium]|nr:glycosyltransferase family 4 protein [Gammaproteobacteria bacterium]